MADILVMETIKQIELLPAIPVAAKMVLKQLDQDSFELVKFCGAVEKDPAMVAKLLAIANSAYYAGAGKILGVKEAVVRLGVDETRRVVLAITLSKSFDWSACSSFNAAWYWEDALNVADCAQRIAVLMDDSDVQDAAYAAGLLHNIGILVLIQLFPAKMAAICTKVDRMVFGHVISRHMDIDHRQAGAMLLQQWELPAPFVVVTGHLADKYQGDHSRLLNLIRFSLQWYGFRFAAIPEYDPYKALNIDKAGLRRLASEVRQQKVKNEQLAAMLIYS